MPDLPEIHEVDKTVQKVGEVQFMSKDAFKNPPPKGLQTILTIVKKFAVYASGIMATTTIFTGNQTKIILFISVMVYGLCDAAQAATGVVSTENK